MKKNGYNQQEISNLQPLLLSPDPNNVQLGIQLIAAREDKVSKEISCWLAMLGKFHPEEAIRETAMGLLMAKSSSLATCNRYLRLLRVFDKEGSPKASYERAAKDFLSSLYFKQGYFLLNSFWWGMYRGLIAQFKHAGKLREAVEISDHILQKVPTDYLLNSDRFNMVSEFIAKGEMYERIPDQIAWLENWLKMHSRSGAMVYCSIAQYYGLLGDFEQTERYYQLALSPEYAGNYYEAKSCNNLAVLYCEHPNATRLARAYELANRAVELQPKEHYHTETLAYLEWKYKLNFSQALELFEETLQIDHSNLAAHANKAALLVELKQPYKAQVHLEFILQSPLKFSPEYRKSAQKGLLLYQKLIETTYQEPEKLPELEKALASLAEKLQK